MESSKRNPIFIEIYNIMLCQLRDDQAPWKSLLQ